MPRVIALLLVAWVSTSQPLQASSVEVGGWLTYWDLDRGLERLDSPSGQGLEEIFLFSAALLPNGDIVLLEDEATVRRTIEKLTHEGRRVWLTIVNDVLSMEAGARPVLKDPDVVHRIVSNPTLLASHRDAIVALARKLRVSGIDIDYENLHAADRDRFTDFIASLSSALHEGEVGISVTVQPKSRESVSRGPGAADWAALCSHVERLQVMLYNQHSGKTGPGPIAGRKWMASVLDFALGECVPSRIIPVLKVSGMEWSPAGVRGIQHEECVKLARQEGAAIARDEKELVPYFSYTGKGGLVTVYFEDVVSIEAKLRLIRDMGFRNALLWSLGREDPEILARVAS
jgi:spore germination protein YaaH